MAECRPARTDITDTPLTPARLTATMVLIGLWAASSSELAHGSTALVGWDVGAWRMGGTDVRGTVIRAGDVHGVVDAAL